MSDTSAALRGTYEKIYKGSMHLVRCEQSAFDDRRYTDQIGRLVQAGVQLIMEVGGCVPSRDICKLVAQRREKLSSIIYLMPDCLRESDGKRISTLNVTRLLHRYARDPEVMSLGLTNAQLAQIRKEIGYVGKVVVTNDIEQELLGPHGSGTLIYDENHMRLEPVTDLQKPIVESRLKENAGKFIVRSDEERARMRYMALCIRETILGTCAIIDHSDDAVEIAQVITPSHRTGNGIAQKTIEAAVAHIYERENPVIFGITPDAAMAHIFWLSNFSSEALTSALRHPKPWFPEHLLHYPQSKSDEEKKFLYLKPE